jgi:NAD(P)-dependent dehydrogenase (short-subunit alcohol dehydrogenase family)
VTDVDISGKTTIVVGASRGLGRGITTALADAGDATVAGSLLDRYEPEAVILVAGARPLMRPLQH